MSGVASGLEGQMYPISLSMLLLVRAKIKEYSDFYLESNVSGSGAFNNIKFVTDNLVQFIHLKSKATTINSITFKNLIQSKLGKISGDYNLLRFIISCMKIEEHIYATDKNINFRAILFTNIKLGVNDTTNVIEIQDFEGIVGEIFDGLKEFKMLEINFDDGDILKLSINENVKYYKFIDPELPKCMRRIAELVSDHLLKQKNSTKNEFDDWLCHNLNKLTVNKIKNCLEKIIFACGQPNENDIRNIVKDELAEYCRIDVDVVHQKLLENFIEGVGVQIGKFPQKINKGCIDKFFQENAKIVSLNVTEPVSTFTGREHELEKLYQLLHDQGSALVTQVKDADVDKTVSVSGLGGIGKTQLAKMYIKKYKTNYYGRTIWIAAENSKTIKDTFINLFEIIWGEKPLSDMKFVLENIANYFKGYKVLFVFDNVESQSYTENEDYIGLFRKLVSANSSQIQFLITSRDRKYINDASVLDLNTLSIKEASALIKKQIEDANESDIKELAHLLQCFPLALQQAASYIKQEKKKHSKFSIPDYVNIIEENSEKLLAYSFKTNYGRRHSETTRITWITTIQSIQQNTECGKEAIKCLHLMAYMNADWINFETIQELMGKYSQVSRALTEQACVLLERYSMINKREKNESIYQIHRLVQAVIQQRLYDDDIEKNVLDQLLLGYAWSLDAFGYDISRVRALKYENLLLKFGNYVGPMGTSLLYDACKSGNYEAVKYLIEKVDTSVELSRSLKIAVEHSHEDIVELLVKNGADINDMSYSDAPLLYTVVQRNNQRLINLFLENGAFTNTRYSKGQTCLHIAAECSDLTVLEFFLEDKWYQKSKEFVIRANSFSYDFSSIEFLNQGYPYKEMSIKSILGYDIKIEIIELLTKAHIDLDIADTDGYTPLHLACFKDELKTVQMLIEKGADIDKCNTKNGWTSLHVAAKCGNEKILNYLLEKDANTMIEDNYGSWPLDIAIIFHQKVVVEKLIKNIPEFDINMVNNGTDNLLQLLFSEQFDLKRKYESYKIDQNQSRITNSNNEWFQIAKFLIQLGIDVNYTNDEGETFFHILIEGTDTFVDLYAAQEQETVQEQLVDMLLTAGVDVNTTNKNLDTPLHKAVKINNKRMIKCLLQKGANVNQKNKVGNMPLHLAYIISSDFEIMELLLSTSDIKLFEINLHGQSCLHLAILSYCFILMELLWEHVETLHGNALSALHTTKISNVLYRQHLDNYSITECLQTSHVNKDVKIPLYLLLRNKFLNLKGNINNKSLLEIRKQYTESILRSSKHGYDFSKELYWLINNEFLGNANDYIIAENKSQNIIHEKVKYLIERKLDVNLQDKINNTALHYAVLYCSLPTIELLLKNGASLNIRNKEGDTPIHLSLKYHLIRKTKLLLTEGNNINFTLVNKDGNNLLHLLTLIDTSFLLNINKCDSSVERVDIMNILFEVTDVLEKNVNPNIKNKSGDTPLHWALKNQPLVFSSTIKSLLASRHLDFHVVDVDGHNYLHLAVLFGYLTTIKLVLNFIPIEVINQKDALGNTTLNLASTMKIADSKIIEIISLLIDRNADINLADNYKRTPLHNAVINYHYNLVKYLCEKQSNLRLQDMNGCTLLHVASVNITESTKKIVEYLLQQDSALIDVRNNNGLTVLHEKIQKSDCTGIKYFLMFKQNFEITDLEGNSLLHSAIKYRISCETIEILLKQGVPVDMKNKALQTALYLAVSDNNLDAVKIMVEHGSSLITTDFNGRTLLHTAVINGYTNIAKYLCEKNADFRAQDNDGNTILHMINGFSIESFLTLFNYLLKLDNLLLSVKNKKQLTVLHQSINKNDVKLIEFLLKYDQDMKTVDILGNSLLHSAIRFRNPNKILKMLIKRGAPTNTKDLERRTPLHIAAFYYNLDVITLLLQHNAKVNSVDSNGDTPLHVLLKKYNYDDKNHSSKVLEKVLQIAQFLIIKKRMCLLIKNKNNQTPKDISTNSKIIYLLEKYEPQTKCLKLCL